jgi:hypothetical protein
MRLYHYTCEHGHNEISETGKLLPLADLIDPVMADRLPLSSFIWLTDLSYPLRGALGLGMQLVGCDRTRYRYRVCESGLVALPWAQARRELDDESDPQRSALALAWARMLEESPGARPRHWFVTRQPVHVEFDPVLP